VSVLCDLTGRRFGLLVVVGRRGSNNHRRPVWLCRCSCGYETTVPSNNLKSGHTRSCGCLRRRVAAARRLTHGHTRHGMVSRIYRIWRNMLQRCANPKCPDYHRYGGRGIKVCTRWRKFENFLKDMGEPPPDQQIDRIDNDRGYCKSNCRWVTRKANGRNRRSNRLLTFQNRAQCLAAWEAETGIRESTIRRRLRLDWPVERALTEPVGRESGGKE